MSFYKHKKCNLTYIFLYPILLLLCFFKESIETEIKWQTSGKSFHFFIYTVKNPHGYRYCNNKAK